MTTTDNEWQRVTASGHLAYFPFFSNKKGTYHYAPWRELLKHSGGC